MVNRGLCGDQSTPRPHQHRVERRLQRFDWSHSRSHLLIVHCRRLRHVVETNDYTSFGDPMGSFYTRPLWRSDNPDRYRV